MYVGKCEKCGKEIEIKSNRRYCKECGILQQRESLKRYYARIFQLERLHENTCPACGFKFKHTEEKPCGCSECKS